MSVLTGNKYKDMDLYFIADVRIEMLFIAVLVFFRFSQRNQSYFVIPEK